MKLASKLNPSIYIGTTYGWMGQKIDQNAAITLTCRERHAIILLEYIDEGSEEYRIQKIDFLPEDGYYYNYLYGIDIPSYLFGKTYPGIVRCVSVTKKDKSGFTYDELTRSIIYERLKLNKYKGITWKVPVSRIADSHPSGLRLYVDAQKKNSQSSPRFNICGKINATDYYHNCCSWAIELLKKGADIDVPESYINKNGGIIKLDLPDLPELAAQPAQALTLLFPN